MTDLFFSHVQNDIPAMVDVGRKAVSERTAMAETSLRIPIVLGELLKKQLAVNTKGPVFHTAIIAGTMAAKNTAALIPLCHSLMTSAIKVDIVLKTCEEIVIRCWVQAQAQTGVEMEALCGASIAALTVYDMCKSVASDIVIAETKLIEKRGGKHDYVCSP